MTLPDEREAAGVQAYFMLALAPLFWAGNWVVARAVHADIPASGLNFWRWSVALAVILPFCARGIIRQWPQIKENWRVILGLGIMGTGLFQFIVYQGLHYTSATNGVILNSTLAFFVIPISNIMLGEQINIRQALGLVLSFLGMLVIVGRGSPEVIFNLKFGKGDLIILSAMPLWALYTVIIRKWPPPIDGLTLLAVLSAIGVLVMAPIHIGDQIITGNQVEFTSGNILAIAYVGLFPAIAAFYCWNEGVKRAGANVAALMYYLMPAYGMVMAIVFLGESPQPFHFAGLLMILSGVYLSVVPAARKQGSA
ncbi:MAG: DMT family transporter [Hyphomicrobiales bacterium]